MSDVYSDFEQSIYDVLSYQFPSTGIVFSYDNGPEEVTPYIAIQVIQLDQLDASTSLVKQMPMAHFK